MEDTDDVALCLQIMCVALMVYRPLALEELESFINNPFTEGELLDNSSLEYYIGLCGSFLAIRDRTIYFIHQSAKDFFCNPSLNTDFRKAFPRAIGEFHHTLFSKSLQILSRTLQRNIYNLSHPGTAIEDCTPPSPDPMGPALYSCVYWVDHLVDAQAGNLRKGVDGVQDGEEVHAFLSEKYLNWLEALSLARAMPKGLHAVEKLNGLLQVCLWPSTPSTLQESTLTKASGSSRRITA